MYSLKHKLYISQRAINQQNGRLNVGFVYSLHSFFVSLLFTIWCGSCSVFAFGSNKFATIRRVLRYPRRAQFSEHDCQSVCFGGLGELCLEHTFDGCQPFPHELGRVRPLHGSTALQGTPDLSHQPVTRLHQILRHLHLRLRQESAARQRNR